MDSSNRRPTESEAQPPPVNGGDWRSQLQPDSRERIIHKITETLKRHLPFSGPEGENELKQIATRFEDKIYGAATSQSDYLRKISLKMLTMESKSNGAVDNAMPSNSAGTNRQDPVLKKAYTRKKRKKNKKGNFSFRFKGTCSIQMSSSGKKWFGVCFIQTNFKY
ncbi:hypothetical protein RND81_10G093300 [Saponaria officinalis]|uniref:Mediator complex subunit 15 KIX domain-containing protein n=1 Tax=Saponaria officinalis TaxID=3572 RepID=A0AAW1HZS9_SAPOF